MAKKRLVIIYHHGANNEEIAQTDYDKFFEPIKKEIRPLSEIQIEPVYCPEVKVLIDKIEQLTSDKEETEELFLHFSGHGSTKGIPYNDWLLANDDLITFVRNDKVKCCFFSSCKSSELASLANEAKIPVVVGTAGANDIENDFAIAFQNEFYLALLSRRKFADAFEHASAVIRNKAKKEFSSSILTRGEGAIDEITSEQINALQMIFSGEQNRTRRMLPSNFIHELNHLRDDKPTLISWSDDPVKAKSFQEAFEKGGYQGRLNFLNLPQKELPLLKFEGIKDTLTLGEVIFTINISSQEQLPEEIRLHLIEKDKDQGKDIFSFDNYKILFLVKKDLSLDAVINDQNLQKQIPESQIFKFETFAHDLFNDDKFNNTLESHDLPFHKRKEITLNFNNRPNKLEMVEVNDPNKFVRVFLAKNANERLVNFLVNWIKSPTTGLLNFQSMTNPVFVVDNSVNRNLNFMEQLKNYMRKIYDKTQDLNFHLIEFLKEGGILVFKNRYDTADVWKQQIETFLTTLSILTPIFSTVPDRPSLLFFLHEEDVSLSFNKDKFHLKLFSDPDPVDSTLINEWKGEHSNPLKVDAKVIQTVKTIAEKISEEKFKELEMEFCQLNVIEHICDCLKIPRGQIVRI